LQDAVEVTVGEQAARFDEQTRGLFECARLRVRGARVFCAVFGRARFGKHVSELESDMLEFDSRPRHPITPCRARLPFARTSPRRGNSSTICSGRKRSSAEDALSLHRPIEVHLQLTSGCNLDCTRCHEHLRR
jgi:hypothetical protein